MSVVTFQLDSVGHGRETEDSSTRGEEMTSVVVGMESDEVAVEDTEEDFSSDGKDSEEDAKEKRRQLGARVSEKSQR